MMVKKAMSILDINKKRKLVSEQFSLPTSKHQCWNRNRTRLPSPSPSPSTSHPISAGNSISGDDVAAEGKPGIGSSGVGPEETKSAEDYNAGDPESMIMPAEETREYQVDGIKVLQSDCGGTPSQLDTSDSLNAMMMAAAHQESVYTNDGDIEALENYDDDALLEFTSQPLGDVLYSNLEQDVKKKQLESYEENPCAANAILYSFSSGSLKITQEGQGSSREPTIDEEFEEYFSNLLL